MVLVIFAAFWTGVLRLMARSTMAYFTDGEIEGEQALVEEGMMMVPYSSINHLILIILMGCRQAYPERQLDTFIPFITTNIILPFKNLPVAYLLLCWLCAFLFEIQIDFSLLGSLYFSWLYMRLFMITKVQPPNTIGDMTPGFSLSQFFPVSIQPKVEALCEGTFKWCNSCKLIEGV